MQDPIKPSDADVAAEAGHFRSEAIRREVESDERGADVVDAVERRLPRGTRRGRPAFPMDGAVEG